MSKRDIESNAISRSLTYGAGASILWIAIAGSLFLLRDEKGKIFDLALNELGDYSAGVVAPLAFFWFVLGYILQSKELSNNTQVLSEQSEEMKNQTRFIQEQIEVTRSQISVIERQIEILAQNLETDRLDSFVSAFSIYRDYLCLSSASICRLYMKPDTFFRNMTQYGNGYKEVFCNSIKNFLIEKGKDQFYKDYINYFQNSDALLSYCQTFELCVERAGKVDPGGLTRRSIEESGLGSAYAAICLLLNRSPSLKFRKKMEVIRTEHLTERGFVDKDGSSSK